MTRDIRVVTAQQMMSVRNGVDIVMYDRLYPHVLSYLDMDDADEDLFRVVLPPFLSEHAKVPYTAREDYHFIADVLVTHGLHNLRCPTDILLQGCQSPNGVYRQAARENRNCPEEGQVSAWLMDESDTRVYDFKKWLKDKYAKDERLQDLESS